MKVRSKHAATSRKQSEKAAMVAFCSRVSWMRRREALGVVVPMS